MSSTAFRALQVRAEHESGPAEDPPDASVDKTWSQIERAVREIRDAPFAKTLLRRMEDAGFVPNHTRAKPGEGIPETAVTHAATPGTRNFSSDEGAKHPTKHPVRSILRYSRMVIRLGSPTRSAVSRFQLALARARATPAHRRRRRGPVRPCSRPSTATLPRNAGHRPDAPRRTRRAAGRGAGARGHVLVHAAPRAALYENVLRANGGGDDGADETSPSAGAAARRKTFNETRTNANRLRFSRTGSRRTSSGGSVGAARASARDASWRRRPRSRGAGWK